MADLERLAQSTARAGVELQNRNTGRPPPVSAKTMYPELDVLRNNSKAPSGIGEQVTQSAAKQRTTADAKRSWFSRERREKLLSADRKEQLKKMVPTGISIAMVVGAIAVGIYFVYKSYKDGDEDKKKSIRSIMFGSLGVVGIGILISVGVYYMRMKRTSDSLTKSGYKTL